MERLVVILDTLDEPVCCWLPDTTIAYGNRAFAEFMNTSRERLPGRLWLDSVPANERDLLAQHVAALVAKPAVHSVERFISRPGAHDRWFEWTDYPHFDAGGQLLYFVSIARDTTIQHEKEADLGNANRLLAAAVRDLENAMQKGKDHIRLAALGQMASGIAHDFNNSLSVILGFTDMLLAPPLPLAPAKREDYLKLIRIAAQDAAAVVARMRDFYRKREDHDTVAVLDLNQVVSQSVALTQPIWETQAQAKGIHFTIDQAFGASGQMIGCESELREAFTNLICNALDAMPEGGRLSLRSFNFGSEIVMEVEDTGVGMTEDVRRRCLEPFFTTKGKAGTGLGLASVRSTVERHSGKLSLQSKPGVGTTFSLVFPLHSAGSSPSPQGEVLSSSTPSGTSILVVDDEPIVRSMLRDVLSRMGYAVTDAPDAQVALQRCRQQEFSLVITDLAMPGMNGRELAIALRELYPAQPLMILTGFDATLLNPGDQLLADLILSKPVSSEELRQAVHSLLMG